MLVVVHQLDIEAQCIDKGVDRPIAAALAGYGGAVFRQSHFDLHRFGIIGVLHQFMRAIRKRRGLIEILAGENGVDIGGRHFAAAGVGHFLHGARKLDLQAARQLQAEFLLQQIGHAALAGLAVDADDGVVAAAQVGRVDRQIRHFPDGVRLLLGEAFFDGVLMRAGEGGEDQVADIGMARVHGQLVAFFHHLAHRVDVGEIQARVHALRVQIHRQGHQVDIAGALAIAEQAAFDPVGAGHHGQFGRGDGGAAVVMRVHADDDGFAVVQVAAHPLDLVGIHVRRAAFDGRRQIEDHFIRRRRLPDGGHRIADIARKIQFGGGEGLGRVFETPFGLGMARHQVLDQLRAGDGDLGDFLARHIEDDLAEHRRHRVIQVDDGALGAHRRFHRAADQFIARLRQDDDGDVVGNAVFFDQLADEIEIGLRGRRKTHFDFLQADLHQHLEKAQFLFRAHRLDQGLITVAQIGAHPDRRLADDVVGPGAVAQGDGGKGTVFGGGVLDHHGAAPGIR